MVAPLSPQTREIVKACVPSLSAKGLDITHEMYKRMLANEEIRNLFNMSHQKDGEQPKALALAVLAYAKHIDHPGSLQGMLERIAEKHVGLNILPEHYPYVGKALLGAIEHVLGDAATPEVMAAWAEAYTFLADVLINREAQIYGDHESQLGGWVGWRRFKVAKRISENDHVISLVLVPEDGKAVMLHKPGQYLSFKFNIAGHGPQRRNYSISSAPSNESYKITVKRHDKGVVSNWLHTSCDVGAILEVSAPAGDFYIDEASERPIIFLSTGVGLTPMISMLEELVVKTTDRSITYIHGAHNVQSDIFADRIKELASRNVLKADLFYTIEEPQEQATNITFHKGRITLDWIEATLDPEAIYYICGSMDFMRDTVERLRALGLPKDQVRYELFGSASDPYLAVASA
ncbi:NO-inducible flavohemoprotein [Aristophania vespae]|uniref:nitric oxide dioxygenase n=1 Tax=Aristophania vespae TaxID=2697033 RepID=A0A6P1ND54_9PROT|nr:NO-inducible flavohemoprotein [Aristophania vespae]QHI95448.1 NO-inducible flavohemoprotein [Aristophania vespae]